MLPITDKRDNLVLKAVFFFNFFIFFFGILMNFLFCYVLHFFYILTYEHATRKERYKKRKGKLNIIQRRLTHNYILTKKENKRNKNPVPSFLFT